jgi:hypothetical protein
MLEEMEAFKTASILEQLPPVSHAPILRELGSLGLTKFKELHAIPTPTHENGIVDHEALIREVGALVSRTYRWKAPYFDEHHLHWRAYYYNPGFHEGSTIPERFRDLSTHKLWVPREFHNFIHAVTLPPDVPAMEVMEQSIEEYRFNNHIYTLSSQAINLKERSERSIPLPGDGNRVRDPTSKRIMQNGLYEKRRQEFIQEIEERFMGDLPPDLTHLSSLQLKQQASIEELLPQIRRSTKDAIAYSANGRRGRAVRLLIDLTDKAMKEAA